MIHPQLCPSCYPEPPAQTACEWEDTALVLTKLAERERLRTREKLTTIADSLDGGWFGIPPSRPALLAVLRELAEQYA